MDEPTTAAAENPEEQRRKWIKFEDENGKTEDLSIKKDSPSAGYEDNSNAAVLVVDSGNGAQTNVPYSKNDNYSGAVIDATQEHVSIEKKRRVQVPPSAGAAPIPAPRTFSSVAHRSQSTPTSPTSPQNPTVSNRLSRESETVVQIGPVPPRTLSLPKSQGLQNIPLQEVINGANNRSTVSSVRHDSITLRQGFANGDVIVCLYPTNEKCPWLTPAQFRPELVPEELMAEGLTLTIEEYVSTLDVLVNDFRFNCYNVCYKRILLFWILFGFIVLLTLLFSGVRGIGLFGGGVVWLLLTATGIFLSMWLKLKMSHHLEKCMASINKFFLLHKIILGLDDKGKLSCHKVNLIFVYFDCTDCIKKLNEVIDLYDREPKEDQNAQSTHRQIQSRMDIDASDVIITGSSNTRVSRKQSRAEKLLLRYSQRWVKEYTRHRLDLTVDVHERAHGEAPAAPRHCVHARCPCQFIEEHLKYKPRGKFCGCQLFNF